MSLNEDSDKTRSENEIVEKTITKTKFSESLSNNQCNNQNLNSKEIVSNFFFSNLFNILSIPINFFYINTIELIKFTWSLIGFNINRNLDSLKDVTTFVDKFKLNYGNNHPTFYIGSYNKAVAEAKKDLKFLLVYLHNNLHEDTEEFCKEILTNQEFINFVNKNNLLFWSCSIDLNEGYVVSKLMRENTYPFLALIFLKNNKMVIVKKFEGKTTIEKLLSELQDTIKKNEYFMISSRLERQQRNMDQLIRKQQDQDYQESLKADQEKERKKKEEQDKKKREEQERKNKEEEELINKKKLIILKKSLLKYLDKEPDPETLNTIKILLKLPNGERLERRFTTNTTIDKLFYFVFCYEESPLKFTIKTNFPTRELPCLSPTIDKNYVTSTLENNRILTIEEFGIKNFEVLYVHDLEA